jgi:glycosyltransferase involved in cell wall biosynthesis
VATRIAVVIPAYRVRAQILAVLSRIGPEVDAIYVVDDACPEESGALVESSCHDPRVRVIKRSENGGVGAAVKTGWSAALADGCDIMVKIDGDGQMDPRLLPAFVAPITAGRADYTKGNRFFDPENVRRMPRIRLLGNAVLSFMSKTSSGYWHIFDPTNGYTAITATAVRLMPLDKLADRYFFESDVLFRLGVMRAVVKDIPMVAVYHDEPSSLSVRKIIGPFLLGHLRAFLKRVIYNHYLRSFSVASVELLLALPLILFGLTYGISTWIGASAQGLSATSGQVMIAALPILVGVQLLLAFLQYDIASTPDEPLSPMLEAVPRTGDAFENEDPLPPP